MVMTSTCAPLDCNQSTKPSLISSCSRCPERLDEELSEENNLVVTFKHSLRPSITSRGQSITLSQFSIDRPMFRPVASKNGSYNWTFEKSRQSRGSDKRVRSLPLSIIKRPLRLTRSNDPKKVEALMESIAAIGLQEPIDVLEVDGDYYGFSGCHRFEACERLGLETINCIVRKGTKTTLKTHLM